jgi:hypothetical protein
MSPTPEESSFMLSPIRPLVLGKRTRSSTLPPCIFAPAAAVGERNAMHKLNVSLDPRVHNRAHFGCDPHSVANWGRELLRAEAEERRQASELLLLVGEAARAFIVGYLALHVFALLS